MKSNFAISFLFILLLFPALAFSQKQADVIIQGTVSSDPDGPVIGASITEIDANNRVVSGCTTDLNGHYVLRIKSIDNRISFNYIGYIKQTRKIGTNKK